MVGMHQEAGSGRMLEVTGPGLGYPSAVGGGSEGADLARASRLPLAPDSSRPCLNQRSPGASAQPLHSSPL